MQRNSKIMYKENKFSLLPHPNIWKFVLNSVIQTWENFKLNKPQIVTKKCPNVLDNNTLHPVLCKFTWKGKLTFP